MMNRRETIELLALAAVLAAAGVGLAYYRQYTSASLAGLGCVIVLALTYRANRKK